MVEGQETKPRRLAAREIVRHCGILYNADSGPDALHTVVEIVTFQLHMTSSSTNFWGEVLGETEPYSADGILFSALVHLVRIEEDLFGYGWLPERIRALGLEINPGEDLVWPITREFVTIKNRDGNTREFHRLSS
jgi:hypothetical protein